MGKSALRLSPEENLFNFTHEIFELYLSENELIEFKSPIVLLLFSLHSTPQPIHPKRNGSHWKLDVSFLYLLFSKRERRKIQFISDLYEKLDLILLRDSKTPQTWFQDTPKMLLYFHRFDLWRIAAPHHSYIHIMCVLQNQIHSP